MTLLKTYFSLSNIKNHQINHLLEVSSHGGIAFILIYFKYYGEYYIIDIEKLNNYNQNKKIKISYLEIKKTCSRIHYNTHGILDYLSKL